MNTYLTHKGAASPTLVLLALVALLLCLPGRTPAQSTNPTIYGVTTTNRLVRFSAATPGSIQGKALPVTGLQINENILGIDVRPRTGQIYGLGSSSRLYVINPDNGAASPVGAAGAFTLNGTDFGFDFNPVVDRIRVVSNTGQNLRLHPDTGALAATDTNLNYASGDVNAAATPGIGAAAYTNNYAGTTATTLYDIDTTLDILVTQNPPNSGTLNTVGPLGVNATGLTAFDIAAGTGTAYASIANAGGTSSSLYTVNLTTGAATLIGATTGGTLRDISVFNIAAPNVFAVTSSNTLISFNSATPATVTTIGAVSGLQSGESIRGIDFRPANGRLYALGSTSRLYTIDTTTGAASLVGTAGAFTLNGLDFGFDFNPVPDRIRVTSDADQNLRLNPNDGTLTATDTTLAYAAGDANFGQNPNIVASAYINNFAGTTATTLYGIDSSLDILVTQNPPNSGTLNTVGPLGFNTAGLSGFDVAQDSNVAYAALTAPGGTSSSLYAINLTTGAATLSGVIGGGATVTDIAVAINIGALIVDHENIPSCRNTEYGRVFLNAPAPAAGTTVTFSSTNPAVTAPANLVIPAGTTVGRFAFGVTRPASAAQTGNLIATYNGITVMAKVVVYPIRVSGITLTPTTVTGGQSATGTVTIDCAAPAGGLVVTFTSSNPAVARVTPSVTIPAGMTSAAFNVTTVVVSRTGRYSIRATATDFSRAINLTVNP